MIFGARCKRFSVLLNESEDRSLSVDEQEFVDTHRATCASCSEMFESTRGLNMLRMCSMDAAPSAGFDDRVLRRIQLDRRKSSLSYWSPAIVGAAVACLALLAALQMIARPTSLPNFRGPGADARRIESNQGPLIPALRVEPRDQSVAQ